MSHFPPIAFLTHIHEYRRTITHACTHVSISINSRSRTVQTLLAGVRKEGELGTFSFANRTDTQNLLGDQGRISILFHSSLVRFFVKKKEKEKATSKRPLCAMDHRGTKNNPVYVSGLYFPL